MKLVAVTVGITLLGVQVLAAEPKRSEEQGPATINKSPVTPQTPEGARKIPPVEEPSSKPLPPGLATTSLSGKDVEFLMTAYENGRVLAWLGEIAASKAQSEQVRAVGKTLESTQPGENDQLRALAKKKSVKIEAAEPAVQQSKIAADLPQKPGAPLDRALAARLAAAARKAVSVYEQALNSEDREIREFAERMLPKAKEKLERVSGAAHSVPATGGPAL